MAKKTLFTLDEWNDHSLRGLVSEPSCGVRPQSSIIRIECPTVHESFFGNDPHRRICKAHLFDLPKWAIDKQGKEWRRCVCPVCETKHWRRVGVENRESMNGIGRHE